MKEAERGPQLKRPELGPEQRRQAEAAAGMVVAEVNLVDGLPKEVAQEPEKAERAHRKAGMFGVLTMAALSLVGTLGAPQQAEAKGLGDILKSRPGRILVNEGVGYGQRQVYEKMRREEAVLKIELQQANRALDKAKLEYAKNRTDENGANVTLAEERVYEAAEKLRVHREKMQVIATYVNRGAQEVRQW